MPKVEKQTNISPDKLSTEGDTLEIARQQLSEVLKALQNPELTESAQLKLRDTAAKLLTLRSRLERDRELLEDRIVREHPEWKRIKGVILKALKPYPEAAAAVAEALA